MSNTKIVLNRQSDLILDNAQITAPVGIVKADIPELVGDLSNLVVADTAEASARVAGDASLEAKHNAEMSTEAAAREAAISTETAARKAAISTEASAREFADNAEAAVRAAADAVLQSNIDAEKTRIDAILNASEADKDSFVEIVALINSVDTENDTAFAAYVLSNDAALSTEVARAKAVEASLESDLSTEISAQVSDLNAADAELSAEISDSRETVEGYISQLGMALYYGITEATPRMGGFGESPDGVNTTFTHYVYSGDIVFLNGLMQLEGVDYTISYANYDAEGTVTFTSAPAATDKINIYGVMEGFSEFDDNFDPTDLEGGFGGGSGLGYR